MYLQIGLFPKMEPENRLDSVSKTRTFRNGSRNQLLRQWAFVMIPKAIHQDFMEDKDGKVVAGSEELVYYLSWCKITKFIMY